MSKADFKGAAFAFATWMQLAADEIAAGREKPAHVIYPKADRRKTYLDRFRLQLWKRRA